MAALFFRASLVATVTLVFAYIFSCYLLMLVAGEYELIKLENFVYWLIVTASTVGYGDLSPTTVLGKVFVSLWVIPLGLSLFAFVLAKAGFLSFGIGIKEKTGTAYASRY